MTGVQTCALPILIIAGAENPEGATRAMVEGWKAVRGDKKHGYAPRIVAHAPAADTQAAQEGTAAAGSEDTEKKFTNAKQAKDAQKLAWLTNKYNNDRDDLTQAAIAGLIHQKLDPMGGEYLDGIQRLGWKDGTSWDTYAAKMDKIGRASCRERVLRLV